MIFGLLDWYSCDTPAARISLVYCTSIKLRWWGMRDESQKHCVLSRSGGCCGLRIARFELLLVCFGRQSSVSQVSSARVPTWWAAIFFRILPPKSQYLSFAGIAEQFRKSSVWAAKLMAWLSVIVCGCIDDEASYDGLVDVSTNIINISLWLYCNLVFLLREQITTDFRSFVC